MKNIPNKLPVTLVVLHLSCLGPSAAAPDIAPGPFEPNTESLKKHFEQPEWLQDAKFGIDTHWGPVTHAIQHPDETNVGRFGWYGKQIYTPGSGGFKYHEKYWGGTATTGYKDICKLFAAEESDPDKWAEIFEMVGVLPGQRRESALLRLLLVCEPFGTRHCRRTSRTDRACQEVPQEER